MCFKKLKNTPTHYGTLAQTFHWLFFVLFVAMFLVAEIMMDMPRSPEKFQLYGLHKSVGILLLFLAFLRLSWKLANPTPHPLSAGLQLFAAGAVHWGLYATMFVLPLSGYVMSMAGGHGISLFELVSLPDLIGPNKNLATQARLVHDYASLAVYGLAGAHVLGALVHHFIYKDQTLSRMMPQKNPKS